MAVDTDNIELPQVDDGGGQPSVGTKLSADDEAKYQSWRQKLPGSLKNDSDYDLRGLFKSNPNQQPSSNLHFPDTYKLPNHITFSDESVYNGQDGNKGGHWGNQNGKSTFQATDQNIKNAGGADKLQDYFNKYEPDSKLILPTSTQSDNNGGSEPLKNYYDYLKTHKADVPENYDSFKSTLSDSTSAKKYYDYLKQNNFDAPPTYESFSKTLGLGSKQPVLSPEEQHDQNAQMARGDISDFVMSPEGIKTVDKLTKVKHDYDYTSSFQDQNTKNDATFVPHPPILRLPDEIKAQREQFFNDANDNPDKIRTVVAEAKRLNPKLQKDLDTKMYLADSEGRGNRADVIKQNVAKIKSGDLAYDPVHRQLTEEKDPWSAMKMGLKEHSDLTDDYNFISQSTDGKLIDEMENRRNRYDPDAPVPTAKGNISSVTNMIGQNFVPMAKGTGAAVALGSVPELAAAAPWLAATFGSSDFYQTQYASKFNQSYNENRNKGLDPEASLAKAKDDAKFSAKLAFAQGIAMMGMGTKLGLKGAEGGETTLSDATRHAIKDIAVQSGIAGGAKGIENIHEGKPLLEGVPEAIGGNALFMGILGLTTAGGKYLTKGAVNSIRNDFSQLPPENVNAAIGKLVETGSLHPDEATKISSELSRHEPPEPEKDSEGKEIKPQFETFKKNISPVENVDVSGNEPPTIKSAVINVNGKMYEGANHAEALLKAQQDGQDISNVDRKAEGKFILSDGSIIDRDEAKERFGSDRSERLIDQDENAKNADKEYDKANRSKPEYLVSRHADTIKDEEGKVSGPNEHPLSPDGKKDANDLANKVADKGVTKIISSDLERAKETSRIVSEKTGAKTQSDPGLNTWDIGQFNDAKDNDFKEAQKWFVGHPDEKTYGGDMEKFKGKSLGETFNDYADRTIKAHEKYADEPKSTLMVDHSNNMMIMDAYRKNGNKWDANAAREYLKSEKPEPATLQGEPHTTSEAKIGKVTPKQESSQPSPEEKNITEKTDPRLVGLSEKIQRKLNLKPYEKGKGWNTKESLDFGQAAIDHGIDPEKVATDPKYSDLSYGEKMAVLGAHNFNLTKEMYKAGDDHGFESKQYQDASRALKLFQGMAADMRTDWHLAGQAQQSGEINVDTGSFTALKMAAEANMEDGKTLTPEQEKTAKEFAKNKQESEAKIKELTAQLKKVQDKFGKETGKPQREKLSTQLNDLAKRLRTSAEFDSFLKGAGGDVQKMGVDLPRLKEIAASILEDAAKAVKAGENAIDFIREAVGKLKEDVDKEKLTDALHAIGEKEGLFDIKETPEEKNIRRLENKLEELRQGIVKESSEKRTPSEREKELQDEIFDAKKNLGLIKSKELPVAKIDKTAEQRKLERAQKELDDLRNGIVKQRDIPTADTPEIKAVKEEIFEEKKKLGLIKSKNVKTSQPELTEEQKKLGRLQKQLDDLLEEKIQNKSEKGEDSPEAKKLKEQIFEAKKNLGLIKSKQPIETEHDIEDERQALGEKFIDKHGNTFTPEEAKDVSDYMRKNYIDKGVNDFNIITKNVADDLGLTQQQVIHAINTPKGVKPITDAIWKEQYNRRLIDQNAKLWVRAAGDNKVWKTISNAYQAPAALATALHATVLPFTHVGSDAFRPTNITNFLRLEMNTWKFAYPLNNAGKAKYEQAISAHMNDPNYRMFKEAKGNIDPTNMTTDDYQGWQKMLHKMGESGVRAFNAIKVYRLAQMNAMWDKVNPEWKFDAEGNPNKEVAKAIANHINLSTGTTSVNFGDVGKVATGIFFAPKLVTSQVQRIITEPAKMAVNGALWAFGKATPAEKIQAKMVFRYMGEVAATYAGLLALNAGVLKLNGSNQSINYTDPTEEDFMKFKGYGYELDGTGGLLTMTRFFATMAHFAKEASVDSKLEKKEKPGEQESKKLGDQFRNKLSPGAQIGAELATGTDPTGRPTPWSNVPVPSYLKKEGVEKHTWMTYGESKLPIFMADGFKGAEEGAQANGMPKTNSSNLIKGLLMGAEAGTIGARITPDYELERKKK